MELGERTKHQEHGLDCGLRVTRCFIETEDYDIPCKIFSPETETVGAVIGVHGFAGDKESSVLTALARALVRRGVALVCFDLPAHGDSRAADSFLRVENCKRDLMKVVAFVLQRYPGKAHGIFATSFGGYLTLLCAEALRGFKIILRAPAVTMAESFIEKIIPVTRERFLDDGGAVCGFERKMFVASAFYSDLLEAPPVIPDMPLMIIHGTQDDIIPYAAVRRLAEACPNIRLISVQGADHRFKRPGDLETIVEESMAWFGQPTVSCQNEQMA